MIRQTRGMTLIGFLLFLTLALFVAYLGVKLLPIYLNHHSVISEMRAVVAQPGAAEMAPQTIRRSLLSRLEISNVSHVRPEHIRVERGRGAQLVVAYEVRQHLIGNIDAVIRFERIEPLGDPPR